MIADLTSVIKNLQHSFKNLQHCPGLQNLFAGAETAAVDGYGGGAHRAGLPHAHVPSSLHSVSSHTWQVERSVVNNNDTVLIFSVPDPWHFGTDPGCGSSDPYL